jgi:hypothetical protein
MKAIYILKVFETNLASKNIVMYYLFKLNKTNLFRV